MHKLRCHYYYAKLTRYELINQISKRIITVPLNIITVDSISTTIHWVKIQNKILVIFFVLLCQVFIVRLVN
jgi:hypothetical protein